MTYSVIIWKAVLWGLVILVINMIIGNVLYMNPLTAKIFKSYEGNQTMKTVDDFGGTGKYVGLNMLSGTFIIIVYLVIFLTVYPILPGNWLIKGLIFGIAIVCVKAIPEAFNQYMLVRYPVKLIRVQLMNSIVSTLLFGIYTSLIYKLTHTIMMS